jgi:hypothetical protein
MTFEPKRLAARFFGNNVRVTNQSLRRANVVFATVYAAQAAAIPLFGVPYHRPLNIFFITTDSLQAKLMHQPVSALAVHQLFAINIAWLLSAWFIVMAVLHLALATVSRKSFEDGLRQGVNPLRWFALAAVWALMLVSLGSFVGMDDLGSVLFVAGFAAFMGVCGYGMEAYARQPKRKQTAQWPYEWMAVLTGLAPLLIISLYIAATLIFGDGGVLPMYVYPLLVTLLVLIAAFGANRYLMRIKKAAWRDYAYGELWYMMLGLIISTAVAWQIFAAVLRP